MANKLTTVQEYSNFVSSQVGTVNNSMSAAVTAGQKSKTDYQAHKTAIAGVNTAVFCFVLKY